LTFQRSPSEEAGTPIIPGLDATIDCRIKKAVIGVTELITALVSIHGSLTFLSDVHCFFDPPCRPVWFSNLDQLLQPSSSVSCGSLEWHGRWAQTCVR